MRQANYFFGVIFLLSFAGLSATQGILTECGQTLRADFGTIEYKLNHTYDTGELCAFIIRTDRYSDFSWKMESHGINEADRYSIQIGIFVEVGIMSAAYFDPVLEWTPSPNPDVQGMGAVVVFRTNSSLGTGFRLSYTSEPVINEKYEGPDVILNNATESVATQINLPINSSYAGEIHFSIIVATSNSKVISDESSRLRLTLDEQFNNVDRCRTVARVYKWDKINFYGEMVEGLVEEWVFCADNHKEFLSEYGLFVVVFWTDGVHVGARGSLSTEMVKV